MSRLGPATEAVEKVLGAKTLSRIAPQEKIETEQGEKKVRFASPPESPSVSSESEKSASEVPETPVQPAPPDPGSAPPAFPGPLAPASPAPFPIPEPAPSLLRPTQPVENPEPVADLDDGALLAFCLEEFKGNRAMCRQLNMIQGFNKKMEIASAILGKLKEKELDLQKLEKTKGAPETVEEQQRLLQQIEMQKQVLMRLFGDIQTISKRLSDIEK